MKPKKWIKAVLGLIGFLLFLYLLLRIGPGPVLNHVSRFGLWFPVIFILAGAWLFFQACSWSILQNAFFGPVPLFTLYRIKIISDSLNALLPSANLGGDAARAFLIRKHVPLREGIPGVVFDKTIEAVAAALFLAFGLLLSSLFVKLPPGLMTPVLACLAIVIAGIALMVFFQRRGFYRILWKVSGLVPRLRSWVQAREAQFESLEGNLRLLYERGNFKPSAVGFHFLSRLAGVLEVFIVLRVLQVPVNFIQAIFITTVVTVANTVFFILPGQWGVTEGTQVLLLQAMGYPAAVGLSLGIIRRIRKLATIGVGLILFTLVKRRTPERGKA